MNETALTADLSLVRSIQNLVLMILEDLNLSEEFYSGNNVSISLFFISQLNALVADHLRLSGVSQANILLHMFNSARVVIDLLLHQTFIFLEFSETLLHE